MGVMGVVTNELFHLPETCYRINLSFRGFFAFLVFRGLFGWEKPKVVSQCHPHSRIYSLENVLVLVCHISKPMMAVQHQVLQ